MFVVFPDPYSLPSYRIGPFRTVDLSVNHLLPDNNLIDDYLKERFRGKYFTYRINGRSAINLALSQLKPDRSDVVTILTTSGNFYISGCVTREIEKFCKWSREFVPETRIIFVNHEFGYPFPDLTGLKDFNLPIIEDCAGSFFSSDKDNSIGEVGDFVIYSFPKMFPLQIGGLLVSRQNIEEGYDANQDPHIFQYIKNVLSEYIEKKDEIIRKRIENYLILKERFSSLGLRERFPLNEGIVPNVFMFRTDASGIDLPELKKHFWAHGVQSSVFYGEEVFFIPVHQALNQYDLDYFYEVMKVYIQNPAR